MILVIDILIVVFLTRSTFTPRTGRMVGRSSVIQ